MTDPTDHAALHEELRRATSGLLGDTIALADEDWRAQSRLPDWTRGHVASHVARQADAVGRLVTGALEGHPGQMYPSDEARAAEIEAGAARDGQDLQTDLDSSAAALDALFARADEAGVWQQPVTLRGGREAVVAALPLARLAEVVLHRVDLDTGFTIAEVPAATAWALLVAAAERLAPRFTVPVRLQPTDPPVGSDDALPALGPARAAAEPTTVTGSTTALLGWLTGRSDDSPEGAADLEVPAY